MIKVLVAEDSDFLRARLRKLIEEETGIVIVGEAEDGTAVLSLVQTLSPDVILMDLSLPPRHGAMATREIIEACPDAKVIVLSMYHDPRYESQCLAAGAVGYLPKLCTAQELMTAVRLAVRGSTPSDSAPVREVLDPGLQLAGVSHADRDPTFRSRRRNQSEQRRQSDRPTPEDASGSSSVGKVLASILRQVPHKPQSGTERSRSTVSGDQLVRV